MKILYIVHRIPYPPNKGDKIRSFHQIRQLSKRHTLHLACLVDAKEDRQYVKTLEAYCASVDVVYRHQSLAVLHAGIALLTNQSLSVAAFYSRAFAKRIARRLQTETFDRILVFSSNMAHYVWHVSDIPKVMDFVDADSEKWRLYADYRAFPLSWLYRLEADRLSAYEAKAARLFNVSIFISDKEACTLQQQVHERPMAVIPNGVDLDYFTPNGDAGRHDERPVITFTGAMDYFPNVDAVRYFCDDIFPLILEALPEAQFYIVGRNPTRHVRALGRRANVVVTGAVADIRPYLLQAMVAVAPLRVARGVQNKILEAMAMRLPVVGTSNAFEGLQATVADGIRMADDPRVFAQEVLDLIKTPGLRLGCSLQARHYVQRCHQWQEHGARLEPLLRELVSPPRGNG